MKKIAAIVSYCTNDRKFLGTCLNELRGLCDPIIVAYGDRFFDGAAEDLGLIERQKRSYDFAKFIPFHVDTDLTVTSKRRAGTTWHWYNMAHVAGLLEIGSQADYVLLVDADEIIEARAFADFLEHSDWESCDAVRFEAYWYFKSPRYRAVEQEVAGTLFRRRVLNADNLLFPFHRNEKFEKVQGKKADHVVGRNGRPFVHHYSWVRTREEMLRKTASWGHKADKDWPPLIEAAFRENGLPKTDFVHGYRFVEVEPYALCEDDKTNFANASTSEIEASVIIPVFNNLNYTRQCITSLFTVKEPVSFEVIVVDNGSSDGTAEYLRQLPPPVRVVSLRENLGFAKGCNAGTQAARGRYLCFLNNDTMVTPGWLSEMVTCMKRDESIGAVGNLQIFPGTEKVQQAGIVCGPDKMVRSLYNNELLADHPAVNKPREFQFVAGSCLLIEKDFFAQLGGFDESYLNSCEDVDLCMRVRQAGKKVFYCPQSRIYHYESKTVSGHAKDGDNYRRFVARWGDAMKRDDLDYLRADGFLKEETTKPSEDQSTPHVGILSTYHQPCGLAGYAERMTRALYEQGITPVIFAEISDDVLTHDGENVVRCWRRDQTDASELLRQIAAHQIEVLHVNYGGMFASGGWLLPTIAELRKASVRVVTTFHTTESRNEEFGTLARLSDHVFVHHSQNLLELMATGATAARIKQIPLGMPAVDRRDIFESKLELGWDPARKIVATFGFVEPHKGIRELIEAMPDVHRSTGAHLHVLGTPHPHNPDSMTYWEICRTTAKRLGLAGAVHFAEDYLPDEEIARRLRASDVIVMNYLSRRYESSAATATALASGRPVISSAAPPFELPYAVTFKLTAVFHLARAIGDVLTNPFIGNALRKNVLDYEKIARWDVVATRIADVYRRVVCEPMKEDMDLLRFYRTHPDEIYAEPLQRERVRWLKSKAEGKILEIGPATGYVAEFTGAAAAVDIHRGRLAVCETLRPNTKFLYGNVVDGLPFEDKEFDQVLAPEILEHVEFDQAVIALKECMRVGKRVLLTLPNADKPDYEPDLVHNIEHRWLVCRQSLERLLRECGCTKYEVDVSGKLDFYLLDLRTESATPRAFWTPRAAALPSVELWPGRALRVAIDVSPLEDAETAGATQFMTEFFQALAKAKPHWRMTAYGRSATPASEDVRRFAESIGGGYTEWSRMTEQMPDALVLPNPMTATAQEVVQAAGRLDVLIACMFSESFMDARYAAQLMELQKRCDLFFCPNQRAAQALQERLQIAQARLRTVAPDAKNCHRKTAETVAMYLTEAVERRRTRRTRAEAMPVKEFAPV